MTTKREGIVLVALFAVFLLSPIALAVNCPLPDTGQTKCYDNSQEIACPLPDQDFYGQDAQYICNPQSYTSLAGGIMVQDNVTGLVWENKTDDGSIHDKDNTYNWDDAQSVFIATLNSQNFGGYSDWRLPNVNELQSIVDYSTHLPSINATYFPNTVSANYCRLPLTPTILSTFQTSPGTSISALAVCTTTLSRGYVNLYVRAVRGGQCGSFGNYVDNGNGTVTDSSTGLMWQQDTAPGSYTWQEALSYCETLTLADYTDWRLPNVNELLSLVDYTRYPAINTDYFPNTVWLYHWSSTTFAYDPDRAWGVYFYDGDVNLGDKSYPYGDIVVVLAVRGGQCGPFDTSTTTTVASTTTTTTGSTTTAPSSTTATVIPLCPSEEIYGEHSEQTEILRHFRDNVLSTPPEGQELIRLYYEWSPVIIEMMNEGEGFKQEVKEMIDGILEVIGEKVE